MPLLRSSLRILLPIVVLIPSHAAPPKLTSLSPEWVQRGVKTEITLHGENLGAVTNIAITGAPGASLPQGSILVARPPKMGVESSGGGISSVPAQGEGRSITITVDVAASALLTDRELRVIAPEGVSNPLALHFSPFPELGSARAGSRESAQGLELPAAVSGVIDAAAQSHFFKFNARKGQHLIADVYAFRLGSKLDSSLGLLDKNGRELVRSEDAAGLDSVLSFEIPADGEYFVELRDFRYQGGGEFKYRMVAGVIPHVDRIFPLGGQHGHSVELSLEGSNLDSKKLSIQLAADAPTGRQNLRASGARGLSNPFLFTVTDLPHVQEQEPNSALDQADVISLPAAIDGRIGSKKDYDAFRFHAGPGQRVLFQVAAYRFGSPLDSLLTLTDWRGTVVQRNDDNGDEDARIDYTFKEEGDYFIIIEDLLGRGGSQFSYLLTAETPQPAFSATLVRDTPAVRRDGRVPVRCEVNRMNGFDELLVLTAEDLPAGVHAEPVFLPAGVNAGFIVLSAAADASLGSFPFRVVARAKSGTREAEVMSGEKNCLQAFLTVLEPAPFSIMPAAFLASVDQNQTAPLEVMVQRRGGFNGEIKIGAEGFSAGREPITRSFEVQPLTLAAGETRGVLKLKARTDSEVGDRQVYFRGEGPGGVVDYSPLIPVRASQIPFVLSTSLKKLAVTALPPGSGSAAAEAVFSAKLERRDGFEGAVELKLEGVPSGVTLSLTNIAAKAGETAIKLVATSQAPLGTNSLTLTAVAQHKDRIYRFQAPPVTLTVNAPEKEERSDPKLANKQ